MSISTPSATAPTEPVPAAAPGTPAGVTPPGHAAPPTAPGTPAGVTPPGHAAPAAAPEAPAAVTPPGDAAPPTAQRTPWYRRAWAIAAAAVLLAVLSFGSGFVAGNAASLFGGLTGGPGAGFDGSRFPDGVRPGDRQPPQFRGDATTQGDGS